MTSAPMSNEQLNQILCIEPNLRNPSGHYCDFVRALGSRATDAVLESSCTPEAADILERMARG